MKKSIAILATLAAAIALGQQGWGDRISRYNAIPVDGLEQVKVYDGRQLDVAKTVVARFSHCANRRMGTVPPISVGGDKIVFRDPLGGPGVGYAQRGELAREQRPLCVFHVAP